MISDDTLTLYYYNELPANEHRDVEQALRLDSTLADRYQQLTQDLGAIVDEAVPPVPAHMMNRFHDTIDRAARLETNASSSKSKPSLHFLSFFWGAAVTAALVLGVGATVFMGNSGESEIPVIPVATNVLVTPAAFTRGLQSHLRYSQFELANMPEESADDRLLLVAQIVEQNRLFERAAVQNNSPKVARVLRAFEPILLRLASDDLAPADAEALRAQLSFELRIVLTKLAQDASKEPQSI